MPELGNLEAHLAEVGSLTLDREIDYSLEEVTRESLTAVDEALERIEQGSFGLCTSCGATIASERLEALPWASLCIDCKRTRGARLTEQAWKRLPEVRVGSSPDGLAPISVAEQPLGAGLWQWLSLAAVALARSAPTS